MTRTEKQKKERPWLFQKGQSGNPKGRPRKGQSFGEIFTKELEAIKQEINNKQTGEVRTVSGKELMVLTFIRLALHSDDDHIKLMALDKIMDRIDGKAAQQIQMDAVVESNSVFDEIDVSKLDTRQKQNLEEILKNMQ